MMKTFLISIVLLTAVAANCKAQSQDTTLVIKFEKTVHDYGTIEQGSDGSFEFHFTNEGKTPLILNNVRSSCGCTVPSWTREPLQPGAGGSIKVVYNTASIGAFSKSVTVNSNAKNSDVVLMIKGIVVQKSSN